MWLRSLSKFLLPTLALVYMSLCAASQEPVARKSAPKGEFTGLVRLGITTSQIFGDGFGGYNKLGGTGGVGTYTQISRRLKFQLELNYAMRGSRERSTNARPVPVNLLQKYELHYIDIPLLLKTEISFFELEFGLLNGIYLFHREWVGGFKSNELFYAYHFHRYELAANLGINVNLKGNWKFNARVHHSILPVTGGIATGINGIPFISGVHNHVISFCLVRSFHPKK
ncbi:MAG: outer membrane beta-barrel protein [Flavobacteriales bacterium]